MKIPWGEVAHVPIVCCGNSKISPRLDDDDDERTVWEEGQDRRAPGAFFLGSWECLRGRGEGRPAMIGPNFPSSHTAKRQREGRVAATGNGTAAASCGEGRAKTNNSWQSGGEFLSTRGQVMDLLYVQDPLLHACRENASFVVGLFPIHGRYPRLYWLIPRDNTINARPVRRAGEGNKQCGLSAPHRSFTWSPATQMQAMKMAFQWSRCRFITHHPSAHWKKRQTGRRESQCD